MQIALTLVGPDSDAASLAVATLTPALAGAHARVKEPRILGDGAVDLLVEADAIPPVRAAAEAALAKWPVDVCVQPWNGRRKRLLIADMDSTIIGCECIDELADFAGIKQRIAAITERAMQGELDFESALRERVGLLAGLEESAIQTCLTERIRPMPGARTLVATLKHHGCRTVLVTGGFHHFADPVAADLGFERVVANRFAVESARLSGALDGAIMDSDGKERVLREELGHLGENAASLATGDGANDVPMLKAATYGVAYHAKPKAREAANGWVDRGDLTVILKLLGISEREWVVR